MHRPLQASYASCLEPDGVRGARIGVMRVITNTDTADPRLLELMEGMTAGMRREGAIVVDPDPLPASLSFVGRPFDEGTLIGSVYACEQATRHRRPPASTPPLP